MAVSNERLIDLITCCSLYRNAMIEMRRLMEEAYLQAKSQPKEIDAIFNNLLIYTDFETVVTDYTKAELIFQHEFEYINRNKARNARLKEKARARRDSIGPRRTYRQTPYVSPGRKT